MRNTGPKESLVRVHGYGVRFVSTGAFATILVTRSSNDGLVHAH